MENTWSTFKLKPATASLYTDDAVVVYVPTGAGARGGSQIRKFYLQPDFSQKVNPIRERVHASISSTNKIVEEAEWEVTFNTGECSWLAPNIDERFLANTTIKFAVIISATFSGSEITSVRFHWDQASVLKQLRVITDKQWPVRGAEHVDCFYNLQHLRLNPFIPGQPDEALTSEGKAPSKSTKAIDAPGRIFGPVRPEDEVRRPTRRRNPMEQTRNIFAYEPPEQRPLESSIQVSQCADKDISGHQTPTSPTPSSRRAAPREVPNIFANDHGISQITRDTGNLSLSASATPSSPSSQQRPTRNILAHE